MGCPFGQSNTRSKGLCRRSPGSHGSGAQRRLQGQHLGIFRGQSKGGASSDHFFDHQKIVGRAAARHCGDSIQKVFLNYGDAEATSNLPTLMKNGGADGTSHRRTTLLRIEHLKLFQTHQLPTLRHQHFASPLPYRGKL